MPMMESPTTPQPEMRPQRRMSSTTERRRSRRRGSRRPASFPAALLVPPTRRRQSCSSSSEELSLEELERACSDAATAADNLVGLSQRTTSLIVERSAGELSPITPAAARRSISLDPAMSPTNASATISPRRPPIAPITPPITPQQQRPGAYNTKGRPADIPPWLSDSSIEQRDRRLRLSQVDRMSWKTLAQWLEDECKNNNNNNNNTTQQNQQQHSQQSQQQQSLPVATPIVSSSTKNDNDSQSDDNVEDEDSSSSDDDTCLAVVAEVVATTTTRSI